MSSYFTCYSDEGSNRNYGYLKHSRHSKDFHRRQVHNPKIYSYDADDSNSNLTPRNHLLNDTFTIPKVVKRKPTKKPPTRTDKAPKFTHIDHHKYHRHPVDIENRKPLPKVPQSYKIVHAQPKLYPKTNFDPFQSVIYDESPISHFHRSNFQNTNKITQKNSVNKISSSSHSTQTPRYQASNKRQKQSIERFVERNRHHHQQEDEQRLNQYVKNSLTYLPRIYLPRIDLYSRNIDINREKEHNNSQQRVYKESQHNHMTNRGHNYDHRCELSSSCSSEISSSDGSNENFVDDCVHFTYPNYPHEHEHHKVMIQPGKVKHPHHQLPLPEIPKSEHIRHIQVLKSPLLWKDSYQERAKSKDYWKGYSIPEDVNESDENDWHVDLTDSELKEIDDNLGLSTIPQDISNNNNNDHFDFWRNDDNFQIPRTTQVDDDRNLEKKVRFN